MDLVIQNHGQVKRTTLDPAAPLQIATPHQREDFELDRCVVAFALSFPKGRKESFQSLRHDGLVDVRLSFAVALCTI
ncbi:hypothetical protein TNCV_4202931 [Trichonephila clavipes]|uniref:Uncharacterized protein n=1 Tax=Trichonephila clavipes TaxID=2585209 RepID=A0A8X6S3W8_TRICX|nr:hypothetical protein TNCV_4202931 [Trichonephila clavipes]